METTFDKIYAIVRRIPFGRATTYGQIALLAGDRRWSRVVGYALNKAPAELPCHRVVNRNGGLSDAFLPMGRDTHRLLLELEGVPFTPAGQVDLAQCMWYGEETEEQA